MKFKKIGSILLGGMLTASLFAGCAGNAKQASSDQTVVSDSQETKEEGADGSKPEEVIVWHQFEQSVIDEVDKSFEGFRKSNPDIKVIFVKQSDLGNKITLLAQSSKDAPDIICGPNDWAGRFGLMNIIVPIDEFFEPTVLDNYADNTKEALKYKDKYYGIPITYECLTFMYNKKLLDKAPETTDELLKMMKEKTSGETWGFLNSLGEGYHAMPWIYGFNGYTLDDKNIPGLNAEGTINAFEFIKQVKPYLPKNLDYPTMDGLFKEGKAASIINGSWAVKDYLANDKIDLGISLIPTITATNKKGQPLLGVQAAFPTASVRDKEATGKVLTFLGGTEVGNAFSGAGYLVANQNVVPGSNPALLELAQQAEYATPMPAAPELKSVFDSVNAALNTVLTEENPDVKEILEAAQKDAVQRIMDTE